MPYFDTHAHIQDDRYKQDLPAVLQRAAQADVRQILVPGTDLADSQAALELARKFPALVCSVGFHPHEASKFSQADVLRLKSLAQAEKVVAIGEIGLDYHYDFSPRDKQRDVFRQQIELADELGLPMIIHEREATADCLAIITRAQSEGLLGSLPGVFHCFSGSWETARILLDMGFFLGFDGPVTYRNAKKALEIIRNCPRDRLLIETDSPYLTPEPFRGKRNEPARVTLVAAKIAEIWDCEPDEAGTISAANGHRLFRIP